MLAMDRLALTAVMVAACVVYCVHAGTVPAQGDNILSFFTDKEKECFSENKILHNNKCQSLLAQGDCAPGEWLVLDKAAAQNGTERPVPACRACQCCTKNGKIYWPADQKCHSRHDKEDRKAMCPLNGTEPVTDYFGDGECACVSSPPHLRMYTNRQGPCYELYTRGPCENRRHVVLPKPGERGVAVCADSNCFFQYNLHKKPHAEFKGRCYELGGQAPCTDTEKFLISGTTLQPECISNAQSAFEVGNRCHVDPNTNECLEEVRMKKNASAQFNAIKIIANLCKGNRRGSKPSKFCR